MATKRPARLVCVIDNTSVPGETECLAAVFSRGRDCAACHRDDCYRQGWTARRATLDNAGRVADRQRRGGRR